MKINKNNVTRGLNKIKLLGIKHSPTIFMVAGLAGVVAGTVMACKATRKLDQLKSEREELSEPRSSKLIPSICEVSKTSGA